MSNIKGLLNIIIFGLVLNLIVSFSLYIFQVSGTLERTGTISVGTLNTILTLVGIFLFVVIVTTIVIGYKVILNSSKNE